MSPLEHKLYSSYQLTEVSVNNLLTFWHKSKQFKSKEALVSLNQQDSNLYFIESGCVRLFIVDSEDEEKNIGFGYSNTFITNFQSFITGKPSLLHIETISETKVLYLSKENLDKLIDTNAEIARWYRTMLETTLAGHIQRQIELLTLTPQERYEVFQKRSGHLINAVPLKLIASYLMMTPETLSRIRARIY